MGEFTEIWTRKTFINSEGLKLHVYHDDDDCDVMNIKIGNGEFWLPKEQAQYLAEAIIAIGKS